jgi:hypothetical protein
MNEVKFSPTPFARALTAHMREWRQRHGGSNHNFFADWSDGIYPDFREDAIRAAKEDEVRLHDHAAAITSSQAFALNLFIPWRRGSRAALDGLVSTALGEQIVVEQLTFEWIPPGALLGEIDEDRPRFDEPATSVDVLLRGHGGGGARVALLVEVKLGEGGFTVCGGRDSSANRRPDVCASAAVFLDDPNACYLRRPWRKARDVGTGRSSHALTAVCVQPFPESLPTALVRSLVNSNSRCEISRSRMLLYKKAPLIALGLPCVLTTTIPTLPSIGRHGGQCCLRWRRLP